MLALLKHHIQVFLYRLGRLQLKDIREVHDYVEHVARVCDLDLLVLDGDGLDGKLGGGVGWDAEVDVEQGGEEGGWG